MIAIEGKDYRMEQVGKTPFYNLYFLECINKGKSNERFELKLFHYSVPFEGCIDYIISKRLSNVEEVLNITDFIKLYKKMLIEVISENTNISLLPKKTRKKESEDEDMEDE